MANLSLVPATPIFTIPLRDDLDGVHRGLRKAFGAKLGGTDPAILDDIVERPFWHTCSGVPAACVALAGTSSAPATSVARTKRGSERSARVRGFWMMRLMG